MLFHFVKAVDSMNGLLKHNDVTQLFTKHLMHTTNWKSMGDPIRSTLLPIFYIMYFRQDIPQGSISSHDEKINIAKLGPGYALWVSTVSEAIYNIDKIKVVIDTFFAVNNLSLTA